MLTDADREIVSIFKRHKVKVEAYVGTLEWAKLHAFANRSRQRQQSRGNPTALNFGASKFDVRITNIGDGAIFHDLKSLWTDRQLRSKRQA